MLLHTHEAGGRANLPECPFRVRRLAGRRAAVQALFGQMTQRNGHQAALSYLTRFADEWPEEGVSAGDGFNFKVIMDKKT